MRVRALPPTLALWLCWSAQAFAAEAYVRFNQLGYETGKVATAYLASEGSEAGATFTIARPDGTTAYGGAVGASTGAWGSYTVYRLDFPAPAIGRYRIVVSGPVPAQSGTFKVNAPLVPYAQPLANALSFYQNERDGSHYIPSALRTAPAHLNDEAATVDATRNVRGDRADDRLRGRMVGRQRLSEIRRDAQLYKPA